MSKSKNGTRIHVGDVWCAKIGDSIILDEIRLDEVTDCTVCFGLRQRANTSTWSAPKRYAISDIKFIELKNGKSES